MTNESAMAMTVEDFLEYVEESKSRHTLKEYAIGIKKFSEYFGKTPNEIDLPTQSSVCYNEIYIG